MNRVYLIGNGFDLSHGLKTNYNDFVLWFIENEFKTIVSQYKNGHFLSVDNEFYSINPGRVQRHLFQSNAHDFYTYFEYLMPCISFKVDFFKYICDYFIDLYKNPSRIKNWFDIEQLYYSHLTRFAADNNVTKVTLLNLFLEKLISNLKTYMQKISDKISNVNSDKYVDIFSKNNKLILDFNYTNTFSKKYNNSLFNSDLHIKIHGDFNSDIIFGYGDEMSKNYPDIEATGNNEYLKHIKSFSYFKNENYSIVKKYLNHSVFTVSVIGHSCGLSDRLLLNEIFENENCKSIEIYFHKSSEGKSNYTDLAMNISRHFYNKKVFRDKIIPNKLDCQLPQIID